MEIIILNNTNIEYWIEKVQTFVRKIDNQDVEALYQNLNYCMQRYIAGVEVSFLAVEKEKIIGMLSAFGNGKKSIWNLAVIYVNEEKRLQKVGSNLERELEKLFVDQNLQCKLSIQCKKTDKYSNIFCISKGFEFEGWYRGFEEKDDMYIWGKVFR